MSDILLRKVGRTGRITLQRPDALNAVTHEMIREIAAVLPLWAEDDDVAMLVIDGVGERAFSAGGDLASMYRFMSEGAFDKARLFWREEYAMNAALFRFPKPVASFMQGFTMGGGVGVGCHGSHRVVGDTSRIAMPECAIGLVPDVGGTLLLARAPGRLGEYLGESGNRMGPADSIFCGFADYYIPESAWANTIEKLEKTGDWEVIDRAAQHPPNAPLENERALVDRHFAGETMRDIVTALRHEGADWTEDLLERLGRNSPLSMAATIELVHRARASDRIEDVLRNEYRFSHRVAEHGEFREGIRAMIVDKDKSPKWAHAEITAPSPAEVAAMLMPLGPDELKLEETP